MKINKIAILHYKNATPLTEEHVKSIQQLFPETEINVVVSTLEEGARPLFEMNQDIDVLVTWGLVTPGLEKFCAEAPNLKWMHLFTAGVDAIMASEIGKMDIAITTSRGVAGYAISDHVLAFIYAFTREIPLFMDLKQKKIHGGPQGLKYDEIAYKTVGIVGLGSIGGMIAEKCKRVDMKVISTDIFPDKNGLTDEWYPISEIDKLLHTADFVVITVPLTDDTRHMIGEKELKMMKKDAYLINVARGEIVDTDALVRAIQQNEIAGAGLDVLENENNMLPDNPIWELPNVIYTPHVAALSPHYMDRAIKLTINNLMQYSHDEELINRVQ
jgi:phosphoglycerate dehydrogenase-like enzyme